MSYGSYLTRQRCYFCRKENPFRFNGLLFLLSTCYSVHSKYFRKTIASTIVKGRINSSLRTCASVASEGTSPCTSGCKADLSRTLLCQLVSVPSLILHLNDTLYKNNSIQRHLRRKTRGRVKSKYNSRSQLEFMTQNFRY